MQLKDQLPKLAEMLIATPDDAGRIMQLRREMPRLYRHLRRCRDEPSVLARWGKSTNHDELADCELVAPEILRLIEAVTDVAMKEPNLHAGLQHTYGYLLSLRKTPYGYKRDRWITGTIEKGFGLPANSLQAFPSRGTLLVNLTVFLSHLSLAEQPAVTVTGAVARFDYSALSNLGGKRIIEHVQLGKRPSRGVELRTDIIPFRQAGGRNRCLLIYSIRLDREPAKLVTTFPIDHRTQQSLLEESRFGNNKSIQLRFNGFVKDFPSGGVRGERLQIDL